MAFDQFFDVKLDPDMGLAVEGHAFGLHLLHPPIDVVLLHLEVGNTVTQQAAGLGVLLIDVNIVTGAGKLLGAGQAGRASAHHSHALAGQPVRQLRLDPAFHPASIDDRAFNGLDGDRLIDDVQRA